MYGKLRDTIKKHLLRFPGGFVLLLSVLAISTIAVIAVILVYSHYSYKNSQKRLFVEKWDSVAARISGEASKAINEAGLIDDEFASYLYWIPALSKEIVAIRLVDDQNHPIYITGESAGEDDLINKCARNALNGDEQFIFPEDFGNVHTIIATPVYINEKIGAVLLLTINDSPENMGIKNATLQYVSMISTLLILWAVIVISLLLWLKKSFEIVENISQLQLRLANPNSENLGHIIESGLHDIIRIFGMVAGTVYVKNPESGEFEPTAYYPVPEKEPQSDVSTNFEPGDPRLQATIYKKRILYDTITKRQISFDKIGKTEAEINIAIPLSADSEVYGVTVLTFSGKNRFITKRMSTLIRTLDVYSATVFRLLDSERNTYYNRNLLYILDIIEAMSSADFVKTALGKISEKIASTPRVSYCGIFIMDEKNKRLILAAEAVSGEGLSFKPEKMSIDLDDMPAHKVAMISGQSQVLDFDEMEKLSLNRGKPFNPKMEKGTIHIVPLIAGQVRIGCLTIGTIEEGEDPYNKKEFFDNIAHYLSLILKNILRYSEIKKSFEQLRATHDKQLKLAKFSVVSELVKGISSNLDSIMQLIRDDVKTLKNLKSDEPLSEIAESIESHIKKYELILQRLREFLSEKQAGKFRQIEVAQILAKMEKRLEQESKEWPVDLEKIRIVILNSGSGQILGNEDELYRAVSNLVRNAAEAMPYGGDIVLESRVEGKMVELEVVDQGSGLNESELSRIFEPFFSTRKGFARGLGLSIAQQIVIQHNGEMVVRSKPGKGSSFIMKFPLIDPEQTALYSSKKSSSTRIPLP
jgi:signal transduction histidine kinase